MQQIGGGEAVDLMVNILSKYGSFFPYENIDI